MNTSVGFIVLTCYPIDIEQKYNNVHYFLKVWGQSLFYEYFYSAKTH